MVIQLWLAPPSHGTLLVNGELLTPSWEWLAANKKPEFKYLGVLFISEGNMECGIDRQIGAVSAIMLMLYQTWKPSTGFTSPLTFQHSPTVMMVISHFSLRESRNWSILFTSEDGMECDKWVLYQSFCMRTLYWTVVVEAELFTSLFTFQP